MDDEPIKRGPGRPRKYPIDPNQEPGTDISPQLVAPTRTAKMRILRGYWPEAGGKLLPGDVVDLPIDEARNVLSLRIAERADEL